MRPLRLLCLVALILAVACPDAANAQFPGGNGLIAFDDAGGLYVMHPDGSDLTRIAYGERPVWSPNGSTLLVNRSGATGTEHVVGPSGVIRVITTHQPSSSWSPDGHTIVSKGLDVWCIDDRRPCPPNDVLSRVFDGVPWCTVTTTAEHIVPDGWCQEEAAWSPTGEWIAFARRQGLSNTAFQWSLWRIRPDGTDLEMLTLVGGPTNGGTVDHISWDPTGRAVAYFTNENEGCSVCFLAPIHRPAGGGQWCEWAPSGDAWVSIDTSSTRPPVVVINRDGHEDVLVQLRTASVHGLSWQPLQPKVPPIAVDEGRYLTVGLLLAAGLTLLRRACIIRPPARP